MKIKNKKEKVLHAKIAEERYNLKNKTNKKHIQVLRKRNFEFEIFDLQKYMATPNVINRKSKLFYLRKFWTLNFCEIYDCHFTI